MDAALIETTKVVDEKKQKVVDAKAVVTASDLENKITTKEAELKKILDYNAVTKYQEIKDALATAKKDKTDKDSELKNTEEGIVKAKES